jgi:hypothetical protein
VCVFSPCNSAADDPSQAHSFNIKSMKARSVTSGSFYGKNRAAILFNKNLLISGVAGFLSSAYVSQLFFGFERNEFANSVIALATEYATYLPLFTILFYLDNRQKYVDQSGKRDSKAIFTDIKKLLASFSVSEIVFSVARVGSQYGLLRLEIEPYEASMLGSLTAWGLFFVSINIMAKITRLHKK